MKKQNLNKKKLIAIVGPTASGKTDLAVEVALKLNGEVISADSRLIFKDFNIGTAKPTIEERKGVPHYFVDIISPLDEYSAAEYKKDGEKIIEEIFSKDKLPIVAGGTGFYVKSLLGGLDIPKVAPNEELREKYQKIAEENGNEFLHNILKEKDPITAEKLHFNDKFRVIRALEVIDTLNIPMSEAQKINENNFEVIYVGLNAKDREFLYDRVNRRVDIMFEMGLIEEVKNLIEKYGKTISILKTLGYKEVCEFLDGNITEFECRELIKKNTRNFAKRQLTWFRANKETNWFYIDEISKEEIIERVVRLYNV